MNYVLVEEGCAIEKCQAIGLSGATGDAGDRKVLRYVHIKAEIKNQNGSFTKVNPENYLPFIYDAQGNVSYDPCAN